MKPLLKVAKTKAQKMFDAGKLSEDAIERLKKLNLLQTKEYKGQRSGRTPSRWLRMSDYMHNREMLKPDWDLTRLKDDFFNQANFMKLDREHGDNQGFSNFQKHVESDDFQKKIDRNRLKRKVIGQAKKYALPAAGIGAAALGTGMYLRHRRNKKQEDEV